MLKDLPDILTVEEMAKVLRIGINAAYALVHDGTIRTRRVGRKYLVPKKCVLDYIEETRYIDTVNVAGLPSMKGASTNDRQPAN